MFFKILAATIALKLLFGNLYIARTVDVEKKTEEKTEEKTED